jgi:hypothetical protein
MQWRKHRFRVTSLWLALFISFLSGVGLAYYGWELDSLPVLACLVFAVVGFWRRTSLALIFILVCGLVLGLDRGGLFMQKQHQYDLLYGQKVSMTVVALDDAVYGKGGQLSFDGGNVTLDSGQKLTGKIEVSGFGMNSVFQGDTGA